jgi:hypothetical protein
MKMNIGNKDIVDVKKNKIKNFLFEITITQYHQRV